MKQDYSAAESSLYEKVLVTPHDDDGTAIQHAQTMRNHSDDDFVIELHRFDSWVLPEK
jgi:hypothetical protein